MSLPSFWMVYVEGAQVLGKKHASTVLAIEEAKRLVRETGKTAYVMSVYTGFAAAPIHRFEAVELEAEF